MADINLISTSSSGFEETDFDQIKDVLQDGGVTLPDAATIASKSATFNNKSGNYTLLSTDNNKIIEVDTTATITLPDGLDTGFQCIIVNTGSSQIITLDATTTLTTKNSDVTIVSQYGAATVYHAGSNVWRAFGDLS